MCAASYRPRSPRISIRRDAVLTESDGCELDVMIIEVSSGGFRLQSSSELVPGDDVSLQVRKGEPVRGRIQWARGLEAGGVFLDPVAL